MWDASEVGEASALADTACIGCTHPVCYYCSRHIMSCYPKTELQRCALSIARGKTCQTPCTTIPSPIRRAVYDARSFFSQNAFSIPPQIICGTRYTFILLTIPTWYAPHPPPGIPVHALPFLVVSIRWATRLRLRSCDTTIARIYAC